MRLIAKAPALSDRGHAFMCMVGIRQVDAAMFEALLAHIFGEAFAAPLEQFLSVAYGKPFQSRDQGQGKIRVRQPGVNRRRDAPEMRRLHPGQAASGLTYLAKQGACHEFRQSHFGGCQIGRTGSLEIGAQRSQSGFRNRSDDGAA